jgi:hypothetical protein
VKVIRKREQHHINTLFGIDSIDMCKQCVVLFFDSIIATPEIYCSSSSTRPANAKGGGGTLLPSPFTSF